VREDVFDFATSQHSGYIREVFPAVPNPQCPDDHTTEMFFFDGLYKFDSINLDNYLPTARQTTCDEEVTPFSFVHKSRAITILFRPNQAFYDAQRTYEFSVRNNAADPCQQGTDDCHAYATCTARDVAPYYGCTCDQGFSGTGQHCVSNDDQGLIDDLTLRLTVLKLTLDSYEKNDGHPLLAQQQATADRLVEVKSEVDGKVARATADVDAYMGRLFNGVDYSAVMSTHQTDVDALLNDLEQASADRYAADIAMTASITGSNVPDNTALLTDISNNEMVFNAQIDAMAILLGNQFDPSTSHFYTNELVTPTFGTPNVESTSLDIISRIAEYEAGNDPNDITGAETFITTAQIAYDQSLENLNTARLNDLHTVLDEQCDGFSASLFYPPMAMSGVVTFTEENVDKNAGYTSGIFTSGRAYPGYPGFYLVSFTMVPNKDQDTTIVLYLDSTMQSILTATADTRMGRDMISMSTGLYIGEGQALSIQVINGNLAPFNGAQTYGARNTFSAWLVFDPPTKATFDVIPAY
jgi:hypothetical protein